MKYIDEEDLAHLLTKTAEATAERVVRPQLAERLLRRGWAAGHRASEDMFLNLLRLFRPIAAAALLMILVLGIHNFMLSRAYTTAPPAAEALLVLPPLRADSASDVDFSLDMSLYEL